MHGICAFCGEGYGKVSLCTHAWEVGALSFLSCVPICGLGPPLLCFLGSRNVFHRRHATGPHSPPLPLPPPTRPGHLAIECFVGTGGKKYDLVEEEVEPPLQAAPPGPAQVPRAAV